MRSGAPFFALLALTLGALLLFRAFQEQVSEALLDFGLHPEARRLLEASAEDQKTLARLEAHYPDPKGAPAGDDAAGKGGVDHRARFDAIQQLLQHSLIVEQSRREIVRRYEELLWVLFVSTVGVTGIFVWWRRQRDEKRLAQLGLALADLAAGQTDLDLGKKGRDAIGRIAGMIEETSRRMASDQRRLRTLENLSSWQEAARRHAHEMRTPLTGARLEVERAESMLEGAEPQLATEGLKALRGARQELERLARFIQAFTSFAKLPQPQKNAIDLGQLVEEFVATYAEAWPNLQLRILPAVAALPKVAVDRDMIRQVLVNLCDNAALAMAAPGEVRFVLARRGALVQLEVQDDGPGVAPQIRSRVFEPYTTTRKIGEGMGLGLAICRKILLDHGGELELLESSPSQGAVFRLSLPVADGNPELEPQ